MLDENRKILVHAGLRPAAHCARKWREKDKSCSTFKPHTFMGGAISYFILHTKPSFDISTAKLAALTADF